MGNNEKNDLSNTIEIFTRCNDSLEKFLRNLTKFDATFILLKEKLDSAEQLYLDFYKDDKITTAIKDINQSIKSINKELPTLLNTFNSNSERFTEQKNTIFDAVEKSNKVLLKFEKIGESIANIAEIKDSLKVISENAMAENISDLKASFDGYFPDLSKFISDLEKSNKSVKKDAAVYCEKIREIMDISIFEMKGEIDNIVRKYSQNKEDVNSLIAGMKADIESSIKDTEIAVLKELYVVKDAADKNNVILNDTKVSLNETMNSRFIDQDTLLYEIKEVFEKNIIEHKNLLSEIKETVELNRKDSEDAFLSIIGLEDKLNKIAHKQVVEGENSDAAESDVTAEENLWSIQEILLKGITFPFNIRRKLWAESNYREVLGVSKNNRNDYVYKIHNKEKIGDDREGLIDDEKIWVLF